MFDTFRGTCEQGCPLCNWFGISRGFSQHWAKHGLLERAFFHIGKFCQKLR